MIAELISLKLRKLFYGTARLSPLQPRPSVPVQPLLLRMMKFRIQAGLLLVLALTLVSCKRESRIDWALRNKILMVGNGSEPKALDPHPEAQFSWFDGSLTPSFEISVHPIRDLIVIILLNPISLGPARTRH